LTEGYVSFLKDNFDVEEHYLTDSGTWLPALNYNPYPDMEEEVEGIARNIKSLYVSGKVRELEQMMVTFSGLNKYSALIERVFKRYGIPYDISRKKPLGKTRPFLDLLSLLYSVAEDYPRLKFSQFLSSGYFTKLPESLKKWIPLFSIESGIISGKTAWLNFISEGSEVLDITAIEERKEIGKNLKQVFKKLKPLDDIKNGSTFDAYTDLLQKIIEDFGFKMSSDESSEKTPREMVRDLFEQLSFIGSLYTSRMTLSEFIEAFSHILNATYSEAEGAGVKVTDFFETAGLSPEYLFFGGLTDRDMPRKQDMDYILPDNVRRQLGFLYFDKYTDIQRFIFNNLAKSSKNLHLSYPVMDGDDMFLPSSFLYSGEENRVRIPGIFCDEEHLIKSGRIPFSNLIDEMHISPSILRSRSYWRVTDIDAYRACPRKFFIERILGLKPLDLKEFELEAITIGIIIHRIMERIVKEPLEDINYLKDRAVEIIEEVLKDKKIDPYWKGLIKDTFIEMLPDIRENELEIRGKDYISTEVEKTITGEPVKGIKLKGKIDRFDRIGDYVQIIDYKTGSTWLTCSQVTRGNEDLQLFLYAAIMKSHGYKVGRVGIYSLKDIKIKWCPPKRKSKTKNNETIDDYITASLKFLESAVNGMKKGDFRAKPLKEQNCVNCHEYSFCPYIQR
jgi:ATP-dependent helicase/DNAse subunit B